MSVKIPSYAIQGIVSRILPDAETARTSGAFVTKCKCPLCKDYKKRMFIREYPDHYHVYCHNCGYSNGFQQFIKDEYPHEQSTLKEFIIESIKTGNAFKKYNPPKIDRRDEIDMKLRTYMENNSFKLSRKQQNKNKEMCRGISIEYCKGRKLPKDLWKDFRFFFEGPLSGYVGMPMWDEGKKNLLHIQGRLLITNSAIENQQKYLFLKDEKAGIIDVSKPLYGIWRADPSQTVYVTEGTLDAPAFGTQGIATCGATISNTLITKVKRKYPNRVWAVDNFWTDAEGRKLTMRLLEMGESCFIIPNGMKSKDPNNLLEELGVDVIPENFIEENTYNGKMGIAKLKIYSKR